MNPSGLNCPRWQLTFSALPSYGRMRRRMPARTSMMIEISRGSYVASFRYETSVQQHPRKPARVVPIALFCTVALLFVFGALLRSKAPGGSETPVQLTFSFYLV